MNKWKKLWDIHPGDESPDFPEWLEQVKAMGDKLQRTIATGYCGECDIHKEKLEAIRRIISSEYVSNISQVDRILEVIGPSIDSDKLGSEVE